MKKTMARLGTLIVLLLIVMSVSSCGDLFATYTIEMRTYSNTPIYTIQYKLSSESEWIEADWVDENGGSAMKIDYTDNDYPNEAYFDIPGLGTYDFRGVSVLENVVNTATNCAVEYDNMGLDSAHTVVIYDDKTEFR